MAFVGVATALVIALVDLWNRPLLFLGKISYALYLVHVPIGGRVVNLSLKFPGEPDGRELMRHRVSLVWVRTEIKNRLPALLSRRNLQPTSSKRWLAMRGRRELEGLPLCAIPSTVREDCLALLRVLDEQIRRLDHELVQRCGDDPRVQRLLTIPGIGPFTAILLILELGEIQRFPSAKHLASYVGLTPRVRASANRVRMGRISKGGNRLLRWALVVAATQAARRPRPLRAWFRASSNGRA